MFAQLSLVKEGFFDYDGFIWSSILSLYQLLQIQDYDDVSNAEEPNPSVKQLDGHNDVGSPADRLSSEEPNYSEAAINLEVSFLNLLICPPSRWQGMCCHRTSHPSLLTWTDSIRFLT